MNKPKHFHPHDESWIAEQIELLPHSMRETVLKKYSKCYFDTAELNKGKIEELSVARREANSRLRILVGKYGDGGLYQVHKPATI